MATYLLAPNFTFRPDHGPIRLGALVVDPFRPHRVLTMIEGEALEARYPPVERFVESDHHFKRSTGFNAGVAVFARFLEIVGPRCSVERAKHASFEFAAETLVTQCFVRDPDDSEIRARISEPKVRAVMKAEGFGLAQPVYMVTGLKIARGLAVKRETANLKALTLEASSGPAPIPVGTLDVGASINGGTKFDKSVSWRSEEDIVFAYQLLKIELKGWRNKRVNVDEFKHGAAFLGMDSDKDEYTFRGSVWEPEIDMPRIPGMSRGMKNAISTMAPSEHLGITEGFHPQPTNQRLRLHADEVNFGNAEGDPGYLSDEDGIVAVSRVTASDLLATDEDETASAMTLGADSDQITIVSFPPKQ